MNIPLRHCAGCQFLYGLSIVIAGLFLEVLFLNSVLIVLGAFVAFIGTVNVVTGYRHIRKRNAWLPLDQAILAKECKKQE